MNNSQISLNSILIVLIIIFGLISLVYFIDKYDKSRKGEQIEMIYDYIENSTQVDSIEYYLQEFNTDRIKYGRKITQALKSIKADNEMINRINLYAKSDVSSNYLHFTTYKDNYERRKAINMRDEKLFFELRKNASINKELIKEVNKNKKEIKLCHIFYDDKNQNYAFLSVDNYRNN